MMKMMMIMMMFNVIALWGLAGGARSCGESHRVFRDKHRLNTHTPTSGEPARVCSQHHSCCSGVMEDTLTHQSEADFLSALQDTSHFLLSTFSHRQRRFDEFFRELMGGAETSMDEMFTQTYGRLYTQNTHMFRQLFADLRRYYTSGSVSLAEVLADFWAALLERVFPLLNPQYRFTDAYLECVSKHTEQLQPFGDLPHKLSIQVSRALVVARSLVLGLSAGRDVMIKATQLSVGGECSRALMRQWFCPLCRGVPALKPCHSLCLNVMKGCLANQADLDSEWNNFIDALMMLLDKVGGPFNVELAADSIAVRISEGIMFMQENSVTVTAKVFQRCGNPRPTPARNTRSPRERERERERVFRSYKPEEQPTTAAGTNLDRLVLELQQRLRPMRGFWVALPHTICNDQQTAADVTNEDQCWNGQSRGRYLPPVMADGLVNQINNPEVEVDVSRPNVKTRQLLMELRVAVNRLRHARNGRDADFIDSESEGSSASGGGAELGDRFSDDWPGYILFSPPQHTGTIDKPPRQRDRLRLRNTPTNKRNKINGRAHSNGWRLCPALRLSLSLSLWFSLCLSQSPSL